MTYENLVLFRDEKSGRLKVCENQVTMDDILANSEIVPDPDQEDELAKKMAEDDQKDAEEEIQKLTDTAIKDVDAIYAKKEKEIMEV